MKVYWRHRKRGQNLILGDDNNEDQEEIGGFRETKRGIDAYAKTFSYEPGRSEKDLPTIDDAKAFVEHFRPWELFDGTEGLTVEPEVRPALDSSSSATRNTSEQSAEVATADKPVESVVQEPEPVAVAPEPEPVAVAPEPEPAAVAPEPEPAAVAPEPEPAAVAPEPEPVVVAPELPQKKSWWEFWKKG